jgi:hypothetical protein
MKDRTRCLKFGQKAVVKSVGRSGARVMGAFLGSSPYYVKIGKGVTTRYSVDDEVRVLWCTYRYTAIVHESIFLAKYDSLKNKKSPSTAELIKVFPEGVYMSDEWVLSRATMEKGLQGLL